MTTTQSLHTLRVESPATLVDEPAGIVIRGCEPYASVHVTAVVDGAGGRFRSEATFQADDAGVVDTAVAASRTGTYTGVDPYGVWWSGERVGPSTAPPGEPVTAVLTVDTGDRSVEATVVRPWLAPGTSMTPVEEPGLSGLFARPRGDGPFPAVVALAGSSGGFGPAAAWAPVLASHGFATLAIAYFGAPGLPAALERIEIEVVERGMAWLARRDDVRPGAAVIGISRGSELALLAGAVLEGVCAVAAFAPSGVSWAALGPRGPLPAPSWTFRGEDIPYVPLTPLAPGVLAPSGSAPLRLRSLYEAALAADIDATRSAEIPVERVKGPIFLVSGEDDAMWPSTPMADIAVRRAAEHDFPHSIVHLRYPDAGHSCFGVPGTPVPIDSGPHPLTGASYAFGGTRAANAAARADSWPRLLEFLTQVLSPGNRHQG
jgi:dienelactone hydrolase